MECVTVHGAAQKLLHQAIETVEDGFAVGKRVGHSYNNAYRRFRGRRLGGRLAQRATINAWKSPSFMILEWRSTGSTPRPGIRGRPASRAGSGWPRTIRASSATARWTS